MNFKFVKICSVLVLIAFFLLLGTEVDAQCPMCKMAAESNLKDGGTAGEGLNKGILYIFVMPYLITATVGYIWWKNRKTDEELAQEELMS